MIKVVIADDHPRIRSTFRIRLERGGDIQVVGEAGSGAEAVYLARSRDADVVLMDVRMPGGNGLEATRQLAGPGVEDPIPVIVVTTFDLDEYLFEALESGAAGFLLKTVDTDNLVSAVREVSDGNGMVSSAMTMRMIREFARRRRQQAGSERVRESIAQLSAREIEIVREVAAGRSNAEIAEALFLSEGTVKTHLKRIGKKLGSGDRVNIAMWAAEAGLVDISGGEPGATGS